MSNSGSGSGDVFDVRRVRRLVELMKEHELAEVDLQQGDDRIRLKRGSGDVVVSAPQPMPAAPTPAPAAPATAAPAAPAGTVGGSGEEDGNFIYVTSPMVGTFYSASSPDAPDFVDVGASVGPETVVCILEAMKVFNEIPADCSGTIAARLVENGDAIEFGQKLFKVKA